MNAYSTHLPLLTACVAATKGDVIEFGSGDFSTPILHAMCKAQNKFLATADSDFTWLNRYADLVSDTHKHYHVAMTIEFEATGVPSQEDFDLWKAFSVPDSQKWGVAFIDHRPAERRKQEILRMADKAELIVVHDTEEGGYGYEPVLESFKYRHTYNRVSPWTTVVSNTNPLLFLK